MSDVASTRARRPPAPIRVLVADDEQPLRDAICDLVGGESDMEVTGAASDADEAIALAQETAPDVALLDIRMAGGGGGPQAAREIAIVSPDTRVLGLSAYEDRASVIEMLSRWRGRLSRQGRARGPRSSTRSGARRAARRACRCR